MPIVQPQGEEPEARLYRAAGSGDFLAVASILEETLNINKVDVQDSLTPLHRAVKSLKEHGGISTMIIEQLLAHNPDVNTKDKKGNTPLHDAVQHAFNDSVINSLLSQGASVELKNDLGETALHIACSFGSINTVQLLLDATSVINARADDGSTPLHYAAKNNLHGLAISRLLLTSGAELEAKDNKGKTAFTIVAENEDMKHEFVSFLINLGANPHNVDVKRLMNSAINQNHGSKDKGYSVCFEMLNRELVNIDIPLCTYGRTALHLSVQRCDKSVFDLLICKEASIHKTDNSGRTPLSYALMARNIHAANTLLKLGADTKAFEDNGCSMLLYICDQHTTERDSKLLDLLVDYDADFEKAEAMSFTFDTSVKKLLSPYAVLLDLLNKEVKEDDKEWVKAARGWWREECTQCRNELENLKLRRVDEAYPVTFYDLLTKRGKAMKRCQRSDNVRLALANCVNIKMEFPAFANLLQLSCSEGLRWFKLRDNFCKVLDRTTNVSIPEEILYKISEYLENDDIDIEIFISSLMRV